MDKTPDTEVVNSLDDKAHGEQRLADEVLQRCIHITAQVQKYKQGRLEQIAKYRDLYAGKVPKRFRQPFNVTLPVFAGTMDTFAAGFNDDLSVDLTEQEPADYIAVRKINRLWDMEVQSVAPNAQFSHKTRTDRFNALFSGRGFMMNYAISDPEYRNCFEVFELEDAIFQPTGGSIWQNHLYAGRANIVRSAHQLETGNYDKEQVRKLLQNAAKTDFMPFDDEDSKNALAKFRAMSLDPQSADYVGEYLLKLVEMRVTVRGTPYYIVFSPWYRTWVRFDKLKSIFSAEIDPWDSWATHEDNKNFISKSFADDAYGIANAVHTLFNQELTNREKRNLNARAYDREMVPDVAKLDQAQYRPDALVPIDTKGGTRKLSDAIYTFETAQLQGTIDLTQWILEESGRNLGITDLSMGGVQNTSKKATVVLAEQQSISKRLLLRSSPYTEAMGRIVKLFIQGAKDHLPAKKALKRLGSEGENWEAEIRRTDLDLYGDLDIKITSSSIEMRNSQLKKEARAKALDEISANPALLPHVNPKWLVKEKLRSVGEYDDPEVEIAMDTKNYGNEVELAKAHEAIQTVQEGKQPSTFYGATTFFMQVIHDFAVNNRNSLGERKYQLLIDYSMNHGPIAQENMLRKAGDVAQAKMQGAPDGPAAEPGAPGIPGAAEIPSAMSQVKRDAPMAV